MDNKIINKYSLNKLAFIGDAVMCLEIRLKLVKETNLKIDDLHKLTSKFVSAKAQSIIYNKIYDNLPIELQEIMRKGRNIKTSNKAKHATINEYKKATGLEVLLGYLFLLSRNDKIAEIIENSLCILKNE